MLKKCINALDNEVVTKLTTAHDMSQCCMDDGIEPGFRGKGSPISVHLVTSLPMCVVPVVTSGASVHMNEYQNLGANIKLSP